MVRGQVWEEWEGDEGLDTYSLMSSSNETSDISSTDVSEDNSLSLADSNSSDSRPETPIVEIDGYDFREHEGVSPSTAGRDEAFLSSPMADYLGEGFASGQAVEWHNPYWEHNGAPTSLVQEDTGNFGSNNGSQNPMQFVQTRMYYRRREERFQRLLREVREAESRRRPEIARGEVPPYSYLENPEWDRGDGVRLLRSNMAGNVTAYREEMWDESRNEFMDLQAYGETQHPFGLNMGRDWTSGLEPGFPYEEQGEGGTWWSHHGFHAMPASEYSWPDPNEPFRHSLHPGSLSTAHRELEDIQQAQSEAELFGDHNFQGQVHLVTDPHVGTSNDCSPPWEVPEIEFTGELFTYDVAMGIYQSMQTVACAAPPFLGEGSYAPQPTGKYKHWFLPQGTWDVDVLEPIAGLGPTSVALPDDAQCTSCYLAMSTEEILQCMETSACFKQTKPQSKKPPEGEVDSTSVSASAKEDEQSQSFGNASSRQSTGKRGKVEEESLEGECGALCSRGVDSPSQTDCIEVLNGAEVLINAGASPMLGSHQLLRPSDEVETPFTEENRRIPTASTAQSLYPSTKATPAIIEVVGGSEVLLNDAMGRSPDHETVETPEADGKANGGSFSTVTSAQSSREEDVPSMGAESCTLESPASANGDNCGVERNDEKCSRLWLRSRSAPSTRAGIVSSSYPACIDVRDGAEVLVNVGQEPSTTPQRNPQPASNPPLQNSAKGRSSSRLSDHRVTSRRHSSPGRRHKTLQVPGQAIQGIRFRTTGQTSRNLPHVENSEGKLIRHQALPAVREDVKKENALVCGRHGSRLLRGRSFPNHVVRRVGISGQRQVRRQESLPPIGGECVGGRTQVQLATKSRCEREGLSKVPQVASVRGRAVPLPKQEGRFATRRTRTERIIRRQFSNGMAKKPL